ncbi:hypothetical protein RFI_09472 [Reticulomyxa filosa]|uniref:Uncharacterized protein n=1 Tax=Reticulomyxa filosa TaxID=46433 RepID=X6NQL7_RETFI|nr:hypothetical protein RFI_09472 [Reticulomyxa filosa]|eukprot:ETO27657.1 hypothetical protein RFI_09472 [Reticulomyxa filosa]
MQVDPQPSHMSKWRKWRTYKHPELNQYVSDQILLNNNLTRVCENIERSEKGVNGLNVADSIWLCEYLLENGGRALIRRFNHHVLEEKRCVKNPHFYVSSTSLFTLYKRYCVFLMLGRKTIEPLQLQKWWKSVQDSFSWMNERTSVSKKEKDTSVSTQKTSPQKRRKKVKKPSFLNSQSKTRTASQKLQAIRDVVTYARSMDDLSQSLQVTPHTIRTWMTCLSQIITKYHQEIDVETKYLNDLKQLDAQSHDGVMNVTAVGNDSTQDKLLLRKPLLDSERKELVSVVEHYLKRRRKRQKRKRDKEIAILNEEMSHWVLSSDESTELPSDFDR